MSKRDNFLKLVTWKKTKTLDNINNRIEKRNTMKTSNLPPELVEKMKEACLGETYFNAIISNPLSKKCAKIAEEHADNWKGHYMLQKEATIEAIKQRDELLEAMRVDNIFLEKWIRLLETKNWHEEVVQEMKDTLEQNEQLLKKQEDGKE